MNLELLWIQIYIPPFTISYEIMGKSFGLFNP